ncbi:hypothetical protein TSUD_38580 [Trifolium subterraneum]|uniref:Uncharacterized protein n=1 Tax=Trifolium subterraneum TaxID=3900 RepID=A0A2Z6MY56_TRISU|nr:hypothetical protein TSUD_38580 [Trifolium subterraneum]
MYSIADSIPSVMAQPPLSPYLSNCCKKDTVLKRDSEGCHCVYPVKLDLLLLNVSQNPDWNLFLDELAAQLGLQATQIELINFYVQLDSRFVNDYRVLNLTWFKPPPHSQAPTFAVSTVKAPERQEPTATSSSTSDRGRHSNLVFILGIVTGILIISIICVLILCL